jgi:hypothetical protein
VTSILATEYTPIQCTTAKNTNLNTTGVGSKIAFSLELWQVRDINIKTIL